MPKRKNFKLKGVFILARKLDLDTELIIKEYLAGKTAPQLAEQFNCSLTAILNRLKANNIPRRNSGFNNEERKSTKIKKIERDLKKRPSRKLSFFD